MKSVNFQVDETLYSDYKKKCAETGVKLCSHLLFKIREVAYGYSDLAQRRAKSVDNKD